MATHTIQKETNQTYFVTFTCYRWLPLFETTNLYEYFDKWFEYLTINQAYVVGYVIMPNHFHGLIHLDDKSTKNLSQLIGNGKRFLAYEIATRLKQSKSTEMLMYLTKSVSLKEKQKNKKHHVFIPSYDAKLCIDKSMVETKLDYIHHNPVQGKWNLVEDWANYSYSSAGFYEMAQKNRFLKDYRDFF